MEPGFAKANPVRRGPVVLAIDGTEHGGSAVVAARMIAARLDLPLEVITVLEPTPMSSATLDVGVRGDPADDDARRQTREIAVTDYVCRFSGGDTPPVFTYASATSRMRSVASRTRCSRRPLCWATASQLTDSR